MECPKCHHQNPTGAKFCMECGAKLENVCPKCGAKLPSEAKFCMECGAKVVERTVSSLEEASKETKATPPPKLEEMHAQLQRFIPQSLAEKMHLAEQASEGENRLVTALFADISGFTPMSQRLPTEAVVEKVNQCFKAVIDAVSRYEGSVNRFIGDCALCFFGAPISHENDPERAILAALDMQKEVQKLELNISVGINTGLMYFGPIGTPKHHEVSAYGTDINLAKRLQETTKAGQILVGEGTYRLTRRAFEFEPLPPLTLKGIPKPVSAYLALSVLPKPEKLRGIEGLKAPMIGRDEEFAKLQGCLEDLLKGRGQIISIIGVAGVGKSRLVSELKALTITPGPSPIKGEENLPSPSPLVGEGRGEGAKPLWLEGRCLSIGESVGYWVFIDILKSYFQFDAQDDEKAMGEKITSAVKALVPQQADEILPLFGNLLSIKFGNELDDRLKFASPEQIKHQTFMALRDFLFTLAQRQPLVLVFEDLHWGDNLSLDLISLLMEMLSLAPLMLICVYRPEQDHKSWRISTIASSKCLERYTEIHLRELRPQESRRMVEELLRIENLPEQVKELVLQKSEGNPFFVEEVIRSLIDSGIVVKEGEIWKAKTEISSLTVPDTIQSVIMSRIDRLEEEVKYVLQCASVIGRLFRHRLLGYTSQRERELDKYLWRLEDKELIYEARAMPELEYSFKHVLTQETAYQSLLQRRRQEFHRKVGEGIETLYKERIEEFYGELAYHYDKSGVVEKAVEYLLLAGEKARRAYLNDEAIGYFQRALERLGASQSAIQNSQSEMEWRLAALKGLGQIYHGIGKELEAEERFRQAIALGREMGLAARELVRLYYWLGQVLLFQSRDDDRIRIGEEGLALLGDDTESVEAALMNQTIAIGHVYKGNREKFWEFTYRTLQFIQHLSYSEELRPPYLHIVEMYAGWWGDGIRNIEEALKWLQVLEQKAEQHHDLRALGGVCHHMGLILDDRGDLRRAISQYQQGLELFTKIEDNKHKSWCLISIGWDFLSLGELQKASEYAYRGHEITEAVGNKRDIAWSYVEIGTISLCQGLWEKALEAFQKADQLYQELGGGTLLLLGRAYLAVGKRQEALRQFQEAIPSANALSGLEEAYDSSEEFRAYCRRFREEHPEVGDSPFVQWYLEPTEANDFPQNLIRDGFVESLSSDWVWHDPFGDCSFTLTHPLPSRERRIYGLEIHAANGRDLWNINLSAPRILRLVSGDFAVQTVCVPLTPALSQREREQQSAIDKPAIGGILLWKDKENFLRLDRGTRGKHEISFMGCLGNKDVIIGRGRLPSERDKEIASPSARNDTPSTVTARVSCSNVIARSEATKQSKRSEGEATKQSDFSDLPSRVFLRLERLGSKLNALCSVGGVSWFTVGHVEFLVEDPVEVGLHAIGNIDRTVYHGAFPEGTAIRFEGFEVWSR